jgi:hypothetical protein
MIERQRWRMADEGLRNSAVMLMIDYRCRKGKLMSQRQKNVPKIADEGLRSPAVTVVKAMDY